MKVEGCVCSGDDVTDDSEVGVLYCSGVRNCGDWGVVSPGAVSASAKGNAAGVEVGSDCGSLCCRETFDVMCGVFLSTIGR